MKIKTIAANFKKNKKFTILQKSEGEQWITNGIAAYSLAGMPALTPKTVLQIFDVPEDKQSEWTVNVDDMPAGMLALWKVNLFGLEVEQLKTSLELAGKTFLMLRHEGNIFAIDEKYVKPFYDAIEYLRFYRHNLCVGKNGKEMAMIGCYVGFEPKAVIAPLKLGVEIAKELEEIGKYYNSDIYEEIFSAQNDKSAANVDPETGEVIGGESGYMQETL